MTTVTRTTEFNHKGDGSEIAYPLGLLPGSKHGRTELNGENKGTTASQLESTFERDFRA